MDKEFEETIIEIIAAETISNVVSNDSMTTLVTMKHFHGFFDRKTLLISQIEFVRRVARKMIELINTRIDTDKAMSNYDRLFGDDE